MNKITHLSKRFAKWIRVKEKLHSNQVNRPHVTESEVWWISFGENIGSEINGKGPLFTRPGIVFKKLTGNKFLTLPTTSQIKLGSWYVPVQYGDHAVCVILSEARIVDTRRLTSRVGRLNASEFKKVKEGFKQLYLK